MACELRIMFIYLKVVFKKTEEDARETICDLKAKKYLLSGHLQKKFANSYSILKYGSKAWAWIRQTWIYSQALSLTGYVILDTLFNPSQPQFSHL